MEMHREPFGREVSKQMSACYFDVPGSGCPDRVPDLNFIDSKLEKRARYLGDSFFDNRSLVWTNETG